MYVYRNITPKVLELISNFPIVGIIGPRQVGKTTLVKELISQIDKKCIYLDMELPEDYSKLHEPQIYLEQHEEKCVILDEIQRIPNIFSILRALINRYINFLEAAFIVRRLEPYYFNIKKRLVKSPKIYIRDTGILHYLAGINNLESLHGHALIGNSWEGYAIEQIQQLTPEELKLFYYRTHHGTESDLVLVKGTQPKACIEIKYTSQPKPSKGFQIAVDDLKTKINFIITPKSDTYMISKSTYVCNLADFLSEHLEQFR